MPRNITYRTHILKNNLTHMPDMQPNLASYSNLPRFPDGRINYSGSSSAPILNCVVKHADHVLLLKRSDKVANYQGYWNFVAGFIDEPKPVEEKALEEVTEELGVSKQNISFVKAAEPYEVFDQSLNKTWTVYPVLVELKLRPEVKLDWEHSDCAWILPPELGRYQTVIKLEETLKRALSTKI